ncbi:MAG TPA: Gfo/Idh/MocA family oxidoreductase [Tepidisphaeraceae bacterium]|nr:Gfo/Idh/MocA family oxidoreductase [Tepidisphaeraceae bacterium]
MDTHLGTILVLVVAMGLSAAAVRAEDKRPLRAGIIGLDTSHATAFTKLFNDPKATGDIADVKVVAAFPGGSPDIPSSRDRIADFTKQFREMGVMIVDSIPQLLQQVDVVLLESVDGRPHLEQARPVFQAGKPMFIDKPLAGSLADAIAIDELGRKYKVPWFSSSSLRYSPGTVAAINDPKVGQIIGCDAWSPCPLEEHHPDLFWYGVHGVETLYTVMGPGCVSVVRVHTDGADVVVGTWSDGRIGTFRGIRAGKSDYGASIFGKNGISQTGKYEGYKPLVEQIATFFKTRKPPVKNEVTLELFAFMEAADQSKRQGGTTVKLADIMQKAKEEAMKKIGE